MKQKEFYDGNQASSYLTHSVIRLGRSPIYIQKVLREGSKYLLYYYHLGVVGNRSNLLVTYANNPDIDMNPVPLGMLAPGKESAATIYCTRVPRRAWKIGLTQQALALSNIDKSVEKRIRFRSGDVLISNSLQNTILNDYPSPKKATDLSKDRGLPIAFSRAFAIWDKDLYYKDIGIPVGTISAGKPTLSDDFFWLSEKLNEDLNG